MAPKRTVAYVLSFELPPSEAACIIECDVRQKSCVQVAMGRAYQKIASEVYEKRNGPTK